MAASIAMNQCAYEFSMQHDDNRRVEASLTITGIDAGVGMFPDFIGCVLVFDSIRKTILPDGRVKSEILFRASREERPWYRQLYDDLASQEPPTP